MRYPSFSEDAEKRFYLRSPDGGLNCRDDASAISDRQLSACENVWFQDGVLQTRPGFCADPGQELFSLPRGEYAADPPVMTGVKFMLDGEETELAWQKTTDGFSVETLYVFAVGSGIRSLGTMTFPRVSSESFFVPDNCMLYTAEPTNGGGIYALVRTVCGGEYDCRMFEINASLSAWIELSSSDYYVPTVYRNGRGTRYAELEMQGIVLDDPIEPEQLNFLTGSFYAYFSTDGVSSGFRLPVRDLDDDPIICTVYDTPTRYNTWLIPQGEDTVTVSVYGVSVTLQCDRASGMLSFTKGTAEYGIPRSAVIAQNNMKVVAAKRMPDAMQRVFGNKCSVSFGNRVYLAGNPARGNEICCVRRDQPLYFSSGSTVSVGDRSEPVQALASQNGRLIAMKSREIYMVRTNDGTVIPFEAQPFDHTTGGYASDRLNVSLLHLSIGCDRPETLQLCGSRLIWLHSSGTVYTMAGVNSGSESNLYALSGPIAPMLRAALAGEEAVPFAIEWNGWYLLSVGRRIFALNFRKNTLTSVLNDAPLVPWFCWTMPEEMKPFGGFSLNGNAAFCCTDDGHHMTYLAVIGGEDDTHLTLREGEILPVTTGISASFSTRAFDFGAAERRKAIDAVFVRTSSQKGLTVECSGVRQRIAGSERMKMTRLRPCVPDLCTVTLTVRAVGPFRFSDTVISYRPVTEIR